MRHQLAQLDNAALDQPDRLGPRVAVAVLELQVHLPRRQAHEGDLDFVLADADDEDFPAELDGLDGACDAGFDACALEGVGGLDAVGECEDGGLKVGDGVAELDLVGEDAGHEFLGELEAAGVDVGDDEGRGARCLGAEEGDEADGAGAADEDGVAEADVCAVEACERHGEGLQHGAVFERHAVRHLMAPHGGVLEVAAQQARDRGCGEEFDGGAAVVAACEAGLALVADDVGLDGDAVAYLEVGDGFVDGHYYA